ncbi:inositol monophosphatase family protein [Thalassospira lucentensis]|uniref:inositol monophosphatase family protein n=1 Tax=Thalassospira lucentensis TaxID=168935 RepID=UPI003D2F0DCB
MKVDIDKVTGIIREVSAEEIAPRFGQLDDADIDIKTHALDLVTIADTEAERVLTKRLTDLLPGSRALGEEAAHADPTLQDRIFAGDDPFWIIDPVDGTKNFAHHRQPFRCMVGLYSGGETVAAWIVDPIEGSATVAEKGAGTRYQEKQVSVRSNITKASDAKGFLISYARDRLTKHYGHMDFFDGIAHYSCCGAEYEELARGAYDFCAYRTLKPWDHAPGTLLVRESGGYARYITTDKSNEYNANATAPGLLCASSEELWAEINEILLPLFS